LQWRIFLERFSFAVHLIVTDQSALKAEAFCGADANGFADLAAALDPAL
jgi:hypothetical protein